MKPDLRRTRYRGPLIAMAALLAVLLAQPALALTTSWIGNSGNWTTTTNWDVRVPEAGDDASLIATTANKTATYNSLVNPLLKSVTIDGDAGGVYTFTLNQSTYALSADNQIIGSNGKGVYKQSGGSNTVTDDLILGLTAAQGHGTYNLTGGNLTTGDFLVVGQAGKGFFDHSSVTNTVNGPLVVGYSNFGSGLYTMSSGILKVGSFEAIGAFGTGTFKQSSGTHTIGSNLYVGQSAGSNGTFEMSSGVLTVGGDEIIGYGGIGTFKQLSGTHTVTGSLYVANNPGSTGSSFAKSSGSLNVGGVLYVGSEGANGTFTQGSGSTAVGGDLILGRLGGTSGAFTMTSGSLTVGGEEIIGNFGTGTFTHTSGSHTITGPLTLAKEAGSTGTYNMTSGSLSAGDGAAPGVDIQINAQGTFNVLGSGTVSGEVDNKGTMKVGPKASVTWNNTFTNRKEYASERSTNTFNEDLVVKANGYLTATHTQDMFIIKDDFINQSTKNTLWDTELARLKFAKGFDKNHDFYIPGIDNGTTPIADNFNWRLLNITNQNIYLKDGNATPGGAQYVKVLLGAVLDVSDPTYLKVTNIFGDPNSTLNFYYNETLPQNAYLNGEDYHLANGFGMLLANVAVPLPPSVLLLGTGLLGLGALGWRRRKRA